VRTNATGTQVNLPGGDFYKMQRQSAELGFLSQLLCVAADRNPSLGTSYPGGWLEGQALSWAGACAHALAQARACRLPVCDSATT
jgi:hypothetical protein